MNPLTNATLTAMGRAEAYLAMADLVEHWPNSAGDFPFDTLNLSERLVALKAFRKECKRKASLENDLTLTMVDAYLSGMRREWLEPGMLERWVRTETLNDMLSSFSDIEDQGAALKEAWERSVDPSSKQRSSMSGLRMLAQITEKEAQEIMKKFWFDQDLSVASVLYRSTKLGLGADPLTAAGFVMDDPAGQKDLCNTWLRTAKQEGLYQASDGRPTGTRLYLVETAGMLLHLCEEVMSGVLLEEGVPLNWLGQIPEDEDTPHLTAGVRKIRSTELLLMSGRANKVTRTPGRKM